MQASSGPMGTDLGLCLDFTDVVDWRTSDHAKDTMDSFQKLLAWSRKHGVIDEKQEATLNDGTLKEDSVKVMTDAVRLREAIYRIFSAIAHGGLAVPDDIGILNEYLARGLSRARVREGEQNYEWSWSNEVTPDMVLYPIASSAAGLLTSDSLTRVRECANEEEGCGSLFLDYSKSQTRRWCSMESCGNRMKFRAYYERHRHPKPRRGRGRP